MIVEQNNYLQETCYNHHNHHNHHNAISGYGSKPWYEIQGHPPQTLQKREVRKHPFPHSVATENNPIPPHYTGW